MRARGHRAFKSAGRVDLRGIDEHVGSHLTEHDLAQLGALLGKLADGVGSSARSAFSTSDPS
jgi:hypothetical protein